MAQSSPEGSTTGTPMEVFSVFLGLGLTSFGGPVAHLGYFREAFVYRRKWLSERAYADLVALCQFLPGPASSQVGMAIGLHRAGYPGMLAAWLGFTMPSAIALVAFALGFGILGDQTGQGWIGGLKAAAVAVVAHALLGMARSLTPDRERATIAVGAMVITLVIAGTIGQILAIVLGGLAGYVWLRPVAEFGDPEDKLSVPVSQWGAVTALIGFFILLAALPLLAGLNPALQLIDGFYRAGALVFGGGHVVLPLLEAGTVRTGLVPADAFLAGYGAAQAVPGPLFTFAAFLGASTISGPSGISGGAIALVAIFLPSALLLIGGLKFWEQLRSAPLARRALSGVNAAVVGLLASALYDPVFVAGVTGPLSLAVAVSAFIALSAWRVPAWLVVILAGVAGAVLLN